MDLTKLSTQDLEAVTRGDMSAVSDEGLRVIAGPEERPAAQKGTVQRTAEIAVRGALPTASMTTAGALMGAPAGPAGMAAGALLGGVAIPASDLITSLYNLAARDDVKLPSQAISELLDRFGLAKSESRGERMIEAGAGALSGVGGQLPAVRSLAQTAASPITRNVAEQAAMAPVAQSLTAAPSAAAAQYTTEATGNPFIGMLAGVGTSAPFGVRPGRVETGPTRAQLSQSASNSYKLAEKAGLTVNPQFVKSTAQKLATEARTLGFDPALHPKVAAVINRLDEEGNTPKTLQELEMLRRIVRSPEGDFTNPDQQRIAARLVDLYDDSIENLSALNVSAGDKDAALTALKDARKTYGQNKRLSIIEDLVENSKIRSAQFSQSGMDNALRTQFAQLATNKKRLATFSKEEQAQIKRIAEGKGTVEQALRFVGRFAVRGPVSGIFTGGAAMAEPTFGVPLALTAEASKRGAEALREQNVKRLMEMISLGRAPQPRTFEMLPATAVRGLLSSQYGLEQ